MCGICGIFVEPGRAPVTAGDLVSMRDSMQHRGPDAAGVWVAPGGRIGLGHRRLSIIDLSTASDQPMSDAQQSVTVVFNGEIYNHLALRKELSAAGHVFRTERSDTEVLVHGYHAWGWDGLLRRLRGMFAIALWDARQYRLLLARDRLGIKPLYLHAQGGRLLFASEIKAILQLRDVPRAIDLGAMYHYLSGMVAPAPMTLFQGIHKLPAGCSLEVDADGRRTLQRYWHPAMEHDAIVPASRSEAVRSLRTMLDDSMAEHMGADVPVGVLLSGGVDSTTLLAGLTARATAPVHSFSVGYDGFPELDERAHARDMANHFGSEHHEIVVTQSSFEEAWDDIVYHQDEPLADWVCQPLYHVSKLAAGQVKAVLVGEGADELFAGYDGYLRYLHLHRRYWVPYRRHVPPLLRRGLAHLAALVGRDGLRHAAGLDFFIRASGDRQCFWGGAATFWEIQKERLLDKTRLDLHAGAISGPLDERDLRMADSNVVMAATGSDQLQRMTALELSYRLPELLLMRVDKMTMAHSIEARVPFLDHRLVAAACAMPSSWKLDGARPKSMLKDAVRGLIPDRVIDRPKVGFGAPVAHWLRGEFGRRVEQQIMRCPLFHGGLFDTTYIARIFALHRNRQADYAPHLWALYNLASWHDRWIDTGPGSTSA